MTHLPFLWRFRLLRALNASGYWQGRKLLGAWEKAEGGTAKYNPLNTTLPWLGATDYNSAGVKNYPTGADGIEATAATLTNGLYKGIVNDLRAGRKQAGQIVKDNAAEFDKWGTGAANILRVLGV